MELEATVLELHPHDVPEILATPVTGSSESYLDWLDNALAAAPPYNRRRWRQRRIPSPGSSRPGQPKQYTRSKNDDLATRHTAQTQPQ